MAPDQAFPLLAAAVCLPAMGALVLTLLRGKDALAPWIAAAFAGMALVVTVWAAMDADAGAAAASERYPWIPSLGVTVIFEVDRVSALLTGWVALASAITFVVTRPKAGTAATVLALQAAASALFCAGDVFVVLASLGLASVAVARLTSVPRNVLVFAASGLVVLSGWFARYYQMVYSETGFPSTELARWRSLALYLSEEQSLFLLGAFGIALLLPAFAVAVENARRAERLALFSMAGPLGSFFVLRILVPLAPRGAEASSAWVLAFAVLLMAWAGLARGWTLLAVGYQGLVLFGLFAIRETPLVPAEVIIVAAALGFFSIVVTSSPALASVSVSWLVGLPLVAIGVPLWRHPSPIVLVATLAFAMMALGFVRVVRRVQ